MHVDTFIVHSVRLTSCVWSHSRIYVKPLRCVTHTLNTHISLQIAHEPVHKHAASVEQCKRRCRAKSPPPAAPPWGLWDLTRRKQTHSSCQNGVSGLLPRLVWILKASGKKRERPASFTWLWVSAAGFSFIYKPLCAVCDTLNEWENCDQSMVACGRYLLTSPSKCNQMYYSQARARTHTHTGETERASVRMWTWEIKAWLSDHLTL